MDKLNLEDELLILQQGIETPFWKLITAKWGNFMEQANGSLLSPTYTNRDFLAGKLRGMKDLLNYPATHIETLKRQLIKKQEDSKF